MAAARTPGMWSVFRDHPTCRDVAYIRPVGEPLQHGLEIAVVYGGGVEKEMAAQLLAAAPMLLQELRNIANADTAEWDDRTEFEAWAKSRARAAIAKVNGPDGPLSPAWCASVDAELAATAEADATYECETCQGSGEIDETLGGYSWSNPHAECPDCEGEGVLYPCITLPAAAVAEGLDRDGDALEQAS